MANEFRAGLDVLDGEPSIPQQFVNNNQVLLTPHSAFYAEESLHEMRTKSALIAQAVLIGEKIQTICN